MQRTVKKQQQKKDWNGYFKQLPHYAYFAPFVIACPGFGNILDHFKIQTKMGTKCPVVY